LLELDYEAMLLVASHLRAGSPVKDGDADDSVNGSLTRKLWGLFGTMALTVAVIAALAYADAARESTAALKEFAGEQVTLTSALGAALRVRADAASLTDTGVLSGLRVVERPGSLALFLHRPGEAILRGNAGDRAVSPRLRDAFAQGAPSVRIPRDEAAAFGLPARTALAGMARVELGRTGTWDIVAVASAERLRDRELGARRRLVLSVLTAAGLIVVFGGLAMRNQRKELDLERELAVAALRQNRDERLQRASKAAVLGTLAMGVAHEISTPLAVIAARAEQMMPKAANDERLSAGVDAILAQTERIKQVMRGLLGLARGDTPSAERIDPRSVIEQAVGLVEHRFAKAGVRLTRRIAPALPSVVGDPRLLEHAVVNLLLNACDACGPDDEVAVGARQDGAGVQIAVEDAGSGMSPADMERVREPFFTTKPSGEGTGLGLAIAHEIVASHRGTLVFSSRRPRGTTAVIRLPSAEERRS
jgi:two-component system NtrC family sensor kinase